MSATSDAVWSEQGTTPDAIEAALRELLVQRHAENEGFVPARVLNMIAFVDREWSGEIANRLRGVGRYHASRMVVLSYEPRRQRLDARVMIASEGEPHEGELALLRETVVVEIGDRHLDDLLTIADPLVVTDLPTLLWSPHGHHDVVEALLAMSQAILLDSVDEPDAAEALARAWALTGQAYVVDLAWLRSTPWRERVAATFDPGWLRDELREIVSVSVRHHPASTVAAALMAGWLTSRLGWRTGQALSLEDGAALAGAARSAAHEVALRLEVEPRLRVPGLETVAIETAAGRRLSLGRGTGGLRARWHEPDGAEREWTIPGASRGESGVLGEGIRQALLRDPTYVPALEAARALLG
ncbi:MAG TPA: glucose-6-phosphate dehydrogenase assembly protein OpcA [Solirubrobacteraceae bacterium]|nr:glucose-6-phosphate dehydrogenase assembly protein OpcA [Solirubrobacteraceae bacterium]